MPGTHNLGQPENGPHHLTHDNWDAHRIGQDRLIAVTGYGGIRRHEDQETKTGTYTIWSRMLADVTGVRDH